MDKDQLPKVASVEKIIEEVKQLRDSKIQLLLRTPDLMDFLEEHYNTFAISQVKLEFLKRDLKSLLQSPLDLVFYSALIRQIKESKHDVRDSFLFTEKEVKLLCEKYGFEKPKQS